MTSIDKEKESAAIEAVKLISNGQTVGIGTGSTAEFAIRQLAKRVNEGLDIIAVGTSKRSEELVKSLGMTVTDIEQVTSIDITIDGADEFTPGLTLIKGGGGALFREKIVASLTRNEVIIADSSKKVTQLGKFHVPVEVVPFALTHVSRQLKEICHSFKLREVKGQRFLTDQSNFIIDIDFGLIQDPPAISNLLNNIEGILCHGIFINLASKVIMGEGGEIVVFEK